MFIPRGSVPPYALIPRCEIADIDVLWKEANERASRRRRQVVEEQRADLGGKAAEALFRAATFGYGAGVDLDSLRDQMRQSADMGARGGSILADACLLYTSPSPRDRTRSRMPSSA